MPFHSHHHEIGSRHPDFIFSHPIRAMYLGDTLRGFGAGLFGIFAPVYLFTIFRESLLPQPLSWVFVYYGAYWMVALVWMYFAVRLYPKLGFRKTTLISFAALAVHIICLALAESYGVVMFVPAVLAGAAHSGLFWPAYHIVFARSASSGHRGQAVGTRSALMRIARLSSPVIGAFIIVQYGFTYVLAAVLFMLMLALIPYMTMNMHDGHRGGLKPILSEIHKTGGTSAAVAFFGNGAVLPLAAYAWPIMLFLIGITYEQLGFLATAASIVTIVTVYVFGKFSDTHDSEKILSRSSVAYAGAWVLRITSGGLWSAFMADAFANMSGGLATIPIDSHTYDRIAREKPNEQIHLIMMREISINVGKVFTSFLIAFLLLSGMEIRWILLGGIPAALVMPLIMRWGKVAEITETSAKEVK